PSSMGVLRGGVIYPFDGIVDLLRFKAMGLSGRLRFGLTSACLAYQKKYLDREEETALNWFYRFAGKQATDSIWRPMLEVKFGDAADQIPLAWIAGRLRQRVRSRKRGVEKLGYLKGSLQKLTNSLVSELSERGVGFHYNKQVTRLSQKGKQLLLEFSDGTSCLSQRVVFTIPTHSLSRVFMESYPTYAQRLDSMEYLGAVCTVVSLKEKLSDIYWTNMADGNCDFGGVIEQTRLVDPKYYGNRHLVYLSRYVSQEDSVWSCSDAEIVNRQLQQLELVYRRPIRDRVVAQWVFRTRNAAPLTNMGFKDRIPGFRTPIPNVFMASMCHLYPEERSVNNSIRVAAELAREMGENAAACLVPSGISQAGQVGRCPGTVGSSR
ncbi:MAG: FAD-dependent oxidoreductase, partial [Planctomycetota bacterium]|nr:FAD-dependent oxidoreductase [Planctomycetota bacterium]